MQRIHFDHESDVGAVGAARLTAVSGCNRTRNRELFVRLKILAKGTMCQ